MFLFEYVFDLAVRRVADLLESVDEILFIGSVVLENDHAEFVVVRCQVEHSIIPNSFGDFNHLERLESTYFENLQLFLIV